MRIFLSHSSRDETEAARLRDWLAGRGHVVVMPPRSKKLERTPDEALGRQLRDEIGAVDAVVVFVSPFLEASALARIERQVARQAGKPVFAVVGAPTTGHELPGSLDRFDLTLDRKAGLAALDEALARLAAPVTPEVAETSIKKIGGEAVSHPVDETRSEPAAAGPAPTPVPKPAARGATRAPAPSAPIVPPVVPLPSGEKPAAAFEHRIRMSIDDARRRLHTTSVPDWLAWAIRSPVTRSAGERLPADRGGGSAPFTPAGRSRLPGWLRRLPWERLPGGQPLRRSLDRLAASGWWLPLALAAAAGLLLAVFGWYNGGGGENARLREELRNARDRQGEFLTRLSDHLLADGDRETALLLALEAVDASGRTVDGLASRSSLYAAWLQQRDDLVLRGHGNQVSDVTFAPDPCCLLSASLDETVRLWDIRTGRQVLALASADSPVYAAAISADGKHILTGAADGKARLYDAGTAARLHEFTGHSDEINGVAFGAGGKIFATASADRTAMLWDVATKKSLMIFRGAGGGLEAVALTADGNRVATAAADGIARIYDAAGEQPMAILSGHTGALRGIAFDASGGYVATVSEDHTARLWNAYTGKTVRIFADSPQALLSVAFSPDGKRLATGGKDNVARVYDVASGEPLMAMRGHTGVVARVAFAADGKQVATGSGDGLLRLWPLVTGADELTAAARRSASACLSLAQRRKYFLSEAPPAWCIEMQKPPYQTEVWRTWLQGVKAGRKPPLPETADGS